MEINEILHDFKRRWENTFIWVCPPDSEEESMFLVERINADSNKIANMTLTSPEFGKIVLNMGTAHTLKFKYPPVGVFQHNHDAFIFRRVPAKQYKHGLCAGNSTFYPVYVDVLRQSRAVHDIPFEMALDAHHARSSSFKDALAMLSSGKYRSVALRNNFSLMLSPTKESNHVLLFWETPIARIEPKTGNTVLVIDAAFAPIIEKLKVN